MTKVKWPDLAERVLWTGIAVACTNITGAVLLGVDAWKAAALAGGTAALGALLNIARWRLSVLPEPGNLTKPGV